METVYKTFRAEVKGFNDITGEVDLYIPVSTNSVDREEEVVEPSAFKKTLPKFMKRPVLVASHDYKVLTNQIGEWSKLKIGDAGMDGKPKYYIGEGNEQADWGFKLASKGMAAFSIGFIPKTWEDGDGVKTPKRKFTEVELLEISQVIVPSNREAIQSIRSKSVDPIATKLLDDVDKVLDELVTKPEKTDQYIRIPVDRGNHEGHRIRTIDISEKEGIKALYCGTDKVVMTYLFSKDKGWDMEKARAWVKEHEGKSIESLVEKTVSQEEIKDELDYLIRILDNGGVSDEVEKDAWELVRHLVRLCGADIPLDIKAMFTPKVVVSPIVETKPKTETLTNLDIQEAIKRLSKYGESELSMEMSKI